MVNKPIKGMALKRPCKDCPWRTDVPRYLSPERYKEIAEHLLDRGENFVCHKTVDYSAADEENGDFAHSLTGSRTCAGAMIWMQHQGKPNQMMQVMERLGAFDSNRLDMAAPVWRTRKGFEEGVE